MIDWKPEDPRPPRKGWAPGGYLNKCKTCTCTFIGAKRAFMCADCAYEPKLMQEDRDW